MSPENPYSHQVTTIIPMPDTEKRKVVYNLPDIIILWTLRLYVPTAVIIPSSNLNMAQQTQFIIH